jgi:pimeloyl-ACP methyl ester carboxylesterase
MVRFLDGLGVH